MSQVSCFERSLQICESNRETSPPTHFHLHRKFLWESSGRSHGSANMRNRDEMTRSGSRAVVSVDGALVLLLYLSLISELLVYVRGRYPGSKKGGNSNRRFYRSTVHHTRGKRHCKPYHEKKQIHSLDTLWRRMQKATNQTRLVNLQHHVITKLMMEARIQARQRDREKQQQRKERQMAGAAKS